MISRLLFFYLWTGVSVIAQVNSGLKLHLDFSGNTSDISGYKHHGVIIGKLKPTQDRFGNDNCAYQFPRDNSNYIRINPSSDFNIAVDGSFSISLWYSGGSSYFADLEWLFKKENDPNSSVDAYYLALFDGNAPLFGTGRDFAIWAFLPDSIPETKWHHLVGIYENRNWYLYQNDTLRETQHSDKYLIDTKNGFLYIGKLFEGKIDDIRFYNRALTKNEVDTLYHLGSSCGITTGIHSNDNKNHSFRISQNLETHSLLIESPTSNKNIFYSITDLFGRVLQHGRISEKSNLIELTEINNGILILTIRDNNEILIQSKIFNN